MMKMVIGLFQWYSFLGQIICYKRAAVICYFYFPVTDKKWCEKGSVKKVYCFIVSAKAKVKVGQK